MKQMIWLIGILAATAMTAVSAQIPSTPDGMEIIREVQRNLFKEKNIYEEISVILTDELGNRDTRQLRKYTLLTDEAGIKFLLIFDSPEEFRGVALLASKQQDRIPDISVYLPAYGQVLKHVTAWDHGETLFGTDFTIRELSGVLMGDYQFVRREDRKIENISYYVVDVFAENYVPTITKPMMRHFIRQDSLYITRTDYLDKNGRLAKQLTMYDLKMSSDRTWNAAMLLMEDMQKDHSTLIKVNKRIISKDYVRENMFTENWLYENQLPLDMEPSEVDELESELIDASNNAEENSLIIMQSGLQ